jgi:hypothetical protein
MIDTIDNQDILDVDYLQSISEFVATLPIPTNDQIKAYDAKLCYMESIHDEIRIKYKNFMPVYELNLERVQSPGNKYLDIVYNISSH